MMGGFTLWWYSWNEKACRIWSDYHSPITATKTLFHHVKLLRHYWWHRIKFLGQISLKQQFLAWHMDLNNLLVFRPHFNNDFAFWLIASAAVINCDRSHWCLTAAHVFEWKNCDLMSRIFINFSSGWYTELLYYTFQSCVARQPVCFIVSGDDIWSCMLNLGVFQRCMY